MKRLARFVLRGGRRRVGAAGPLGARPKLLIFDFDGTIADTFESGLEILNQLSGEFGFRELSRNDLSKARDMRTRELMRFLGIRTTAMSRIARRGTEELRKRIDAIQPLPGVPEILTAAKHAGFQLGIVTSNSEENVRRFLANHGLEMFAFVRSSSKLMGKGREVRALMKEHGLEARDILLIGDETRDIEAAQEVGAHIAAVTWGYNSRTALASLQPDHIVESPGELLALLGEFPQP
ncbi:MAG: HAD-IA family hydrolase [Terrimicrobiaceae bacterium]|nr:HAD-IA family hydrolase [Terrimicrobiaceae bacterium]